MKGSLVSHGVQWQNKLTGLLNSNAINVLKDLHELFKSNTTKLEIVPLNLDHLSESIKTLKNLQKTSPETEKRFSPLRTMYATLHKFEVQITDEERDMLDNLQTCWEAFQIMLTTCEKMLEKSKVNMKRDLETNVESYHEQVVDLRKEVLVSLPFKAEISTEEAFKLIDTYRGKAEAARERQRALKPGLDIFGIPSPDHKEMRDTEKDLDLMQQVSVP